VVGNEPDSLEAQKGDLSIMSGTTRTIDDTIDEICRWAFGSAEGQRKYPGTSVKLGWIGGTFITPGVAEFSERYRCMWLVNTIASYQRRPMQIVGDTPLDPGHLHEPEIVQAIKTKWDAHHQQWVLRKAGQGATLGIIPCDESTGDDLPEIIVQSFDLALFSKDMPDWNELRIWVDVVPESGQSLGASCYLMFPQEH
jgi:hypothetical protein